MHRAEDDEATVAQSRDFSNDSSKVPDDRVGAGHQTHRLVHRRVAEMGLVLADDHLDRDYYNPRTITADDGTFDLGPMRAGTYELQADTKFGVNISSEPPQKRRRANVKEGATVTDVELLYDGPPPPPVPES